jgi:alpha-L-rhamnosidase
MRTFGLLTLWLCLFCLPSAALLLTAVIAGFAAHGADRIVAAKTAGVSATNLRCEHRHDPLGVDVLVPRLSWNIESPDRNQKQTAFQILVADSEEILRQDQGNLWDSGRVQSDETIDIVYAGKPLRSHERCFWKARVWDREGQPSTWSAPAHWSMGLLSPADWAGAAWIGFDRSQKLARPEAGSGHAKTPEHSPLVLPPPTYLRATFRHEKPARVRRAMLYATALGIFDLKLNGQRVADEYFNPGWTDYTKRVYYRAYDVTHLVRNGDNALAAIVADGWYSGYIGYLKKREHYGKKPRFLALVHLELDDGSTIDVVSGPQWRAATGPIHEADFLMGETYDAQEAQSRGFTGWEDPGFDDRTWAPVDTGAELAPLAQWHPAEPVRAFSELKPRAFSQPRPGIFVFDMGQNFAGVVRLKITAEPGRKITLRYAERLNPDGTIYTTNLRAARATDTYICSGRGEETWSPHFTFHGFQYVEVSGLNSPPGEGTITGIALSSDTPVVGRFACSDSMLNQLAGNIYWTQRANFIDIPTDCPQRDERLGWTGDAQVYIGAATLNCDVQAFFTKWLVDLADGQRGDGQFPMVAPVKVAGDDGGPAWADAGVICPWTIYQVYGDRGLLARQYPSMAKFITFCRNRSTADLLPPKQFHCFGDWLSIKADTPKDVIYTAYFAHSTHLLAQVARALGRDADADKYDELFRAVKSAFKHAYVAPDGRIKGDTQTVYALALAFELIDGENARQAANYLVADIEKRGGHLSTGFIGTRVLMQALSKIGRTDVAFCLLHNESFPSWGFSIKHGATSIWERWDGWTPEKGFQDPGMNSFAHYSFGAVYQWMVENIGGIRSDGPAYKRITIAPALDPKLSWARTSYRSARGEIATNWMRNDALLTLEVSIPANTTATIYLPAAEPGEIRESGRSLGSTEGVRLLRTDNGRAVIEVGSGRYSFTAPSSRKPS